MKKLFFILSLGLLVGVGCSKNTPTVEVPKGWKEYKNEEYGFTLKYPSNVKIDTEEQNDGRAKYIFFGSRTDRSPIMQAGFSFYFVDLPLDEIYKMMEINKDLFPLEEKKHVDLNGVNVYYTSQSSAELPVYYYIIPFKNGYLIYRGINLDDDDYKYQRDIIKTFRYYKK